MNIYHLHPLKFSREYDSYSSFVVIADNEDEARRFIIHCGSECGHRWKHTPRIPDYSNSGVCIWHDPTMTACEFLGPAARSMKAGVVSSSFHAG